MTEELATRRYQPADKKAVWRVHERAFRTTSIPFVPELDRDLRRIPETYLHDGDFLVGTVDGEIVTTGGFRSADERAVELKRMRVDPAYQRNGYGTTLLGALETAAREWGAQRAVLHTSDRLKSAIRFYRARGYRETDREPHSEVNMTLVHFEKCLGE